MASRLPINLEDLLRQRTVERDRIDYKAGWNSDHPRRHGPQRLAGTEVLHR